MFPVCYLLILADQKLGNLYRIGSRPFSNLIAAAPEGE